MMGITRPTRWAVLHFLLLLALLYAAIYFSDSRHPLRLELQHGVFDQFNSLHPRTPTDAVMIVDIDEQSLAQIGQWPWPRTVLSALTNSLTEKGAKAIAFDGVFAEQDRASPDYFLAQLPEEPRAKVSAFLDDTLEHRNYDDVFAQAIKDSGIFITAFTYGSAERTHNKPVNKNRLLARSDVKKLFLQDAPHFEGAAVNVPIFAKNAAGNGSFMARPDADGVLRRTGMVFTDGTSLYPSLSVEALRVAEMGRKGAVKLATVPDDQRQDIDTNYRILIGDYKIPVESDGVLNVYYRRFCNAKEAARYPEICPRTDYISAYKFLEERFSEEARAAVQDKIVLIGASAEGLKDLRTTAIAPFRPGVEVHANVIEQVLTGDYLLRPDITRLAEGSFILVVGLAFILLAPFVGVLTTLILCAAIITSMAYGAYFAYTEYGLLIDPVYPSLAVFTIFVVSTILSYMRAESRRKHIRSAFGMYVAPAVMRDLEKNPDKLALGGENRPLTVMFTDIRKFTSISEGLSPEELIHLMNDFLTRMTDIVMKRQGTVDKYIGDAMMAFWNAPSDVENHEREACLAALDMQKALEPVNDRLKAEAEKNGTEPVVLQAGIGINTGTCAVGNMGSRQRFAYSALGDAVNLAARLEGQTKHYGVSILVGESTYVAASDLALLELDLVRVVGKTQPVRIFALIGDDARAHSAAFQAWKAQHDKMLAAYRDQAFEKARDMLIKCENLAGKEGDMMYRLYRVRIEKLMLQDLPADWDGVYVAEGK